VADWQRNNANAMDLEHFFGQVFDFPAIQGIPKST
jgi:hypothetical protein